MAPPRRVSAPLRKPKAGAVRHTHAGPAREEDGEEPEEEEHQDDNVQQVEDDDMLDDNDNDDDEDDLLGFDNDTDEFMLDADAENERAGDLTRTGALFDDNDLPEGAFENSYHDLQTLQNVVRYNEELVATVDDDLPPVDDSDSVQEATIETSQATTPFSIPSHQSFTEYSLTEDSSEALPTTHQVDPNMSTFEYALGLWCTNVGISRPQYSALVEILGLLKDGDAAQKIERLPARVDTLKRRVKEQLPLLELRKKSIPLAAEQLPSSVAGQVVSIPREDLIFVNPVELFRRILSSQIWSRLHRGLAIFKDNPRELWHGEGWASSVRTTSGEYAHVGGDGEPLFPSDWIQWQHLGQLCTGRIVAVGRYEMSTERPGIENHAIAIKVQEARGKLSLPTATQALLDPPLADNELLVCSEITYLSENDVVGRVPSVFIDYSFQDTKNPDRQRSQSYQTFVSRMISTWEVPMDSGDDDDAMELPVIIPFSQIPPLRAELELRQYTRSYFVDKFDGQAVLSVPFLTFIDGFGLYRNAYRSLMGWYIIIAALTFEDRARRANVHPLTIGPHGSNFADVVTALRPFMLALEGGLEMTICDEQILVCAFSFAYIGDMPQQNKNAGFKGPRANLGCRSCFVTPQERGDLQYDLTINGRYHWQTIWMRQTMSSKAGTQRDAYATTYGLDTATPAVVLLSPALDVVRSVPADPAHSELNGVANESHRLLLDAILTENGKIQYNRMLQAFAFPPGFARIRSPITHLGSYSIAEHARWVIIIAPLLRCWLRKEHIRPDFWNAVKGRRGANPIFLVVRAYAAQAKTCSIMMSPDVSLLDRANMHSNIITSRRLYQDLLDIAATASTVNRRARRATPAMLSRTQSPTSPGLFAITDQMELSQAAAQWLRDKARPNMHTGLHYRATLAEYSSPCNSNVLMGEDKHRLFKEIIYQSNHRHPELFLLERERLQQTVRLVLTDAFDTDSPEVHAALGRVYGTCPSLFELMLPHAELTVGTVEDEDADDTILGGQGQTNVKVIGRIKTEYVRSTWKLPVRASTMAPSFRTALQIVYQFYLGENITHFRGVFTYYNKFAFTDSDSDRRFVFRVGDFVKSRGFALYRVDQIFVHSDGSDKQLFIKVTQAIQRPEKLLVDPILQQPRLYLDRSPESAIKVIHVGAVAAEKVWLIPVEEDDSEEGLLHYDRGGLSHDGGLIHVQWNIHYI